MWSDRCLEVDWCRSVDGFEGEYHHLESDAGYNRKQVDVTEKGGSHGSNQPRVSCSCPFRR